MSINDKLLKSAAGAGGLTPSENFKVVTYTGNGGTQAITGVGFKPDVVWAKKRSGSDDNVWFDTTRGVQKELISNSNAAEATKTAAISSFDSDGFTTGNNGALNSNGDTYVAWCWKANGGTTSSNTDGSQTTTVQANTAAGVSIITGTMGSSGSSTFGHGLGVAPKMIIHKDSANANAWMVYHESMGAGKEIRLNETNAATSSTTPWGNTAPTTTVYTGGNGYIANAGANFVAYCFAEVDGFSKFGSYTGDRTNDVIVETGFEVGWVMIKAADATDDWFIISQETGNTQLYANKTDAEASFTGVSFLSNGFMLNGSANSGGTNNAGTTFIYMAFATDPDTEAPTLADSFNIKLYTGNDSTNAISGLGFKPNLVWIKNRDTGSRWHQWFDNLRMHNALASNNNEAQVAEATNGVRSFDTDGFTVAGTGGYTNANGEDYVAWTWKANDDEPTIHPAEPQALAGGVGITSHTGVSTDTSGKFGKAVAFSSGSINITGFDNFGSTGVSISAWVKISDFSGGPTIVNLYSNNSIVLGTNSSGNFFRSGQGTTVTSTSSMNTGSWYHVVMAADTSGDVVLYLNGASAGSGSCTTAMYNDNNDKDLIGAYGTSSQPMAGSIDQVRIFNKQISASEVTTLYNETESQNDTLQILGDTSCVATYTLNGVNAESIVSANANAGFSIVNYDGSGADMTVPHGLSAAPTFMIVKAMNGGSGNNWVVYHSAVGNTKGLILDQTDAELTYNWWNGTTPTATTFSLGTGSETGSTNNGTRTYIAYCFHDVTGYSKFGSYTGDGGDGTGPTVTTGFQPDFVMVKRSSGTGNWQIYDSRRGGKLLFPNDSAAEQNLVYVDFLSTGFKPIAPSSATGDTNLNLSGSTYIYAAFKRNLSPFPRAGNMSFLVIAGGGGGGFTAGGGGGAGGLRTSYGDTSGGGSSSETDITLAAGTYTITIGSGGAGSGSGSARGTSGGDSSIAASGLTTITSTGGGGGGTRGSGIYSGLSGGSGGGEAGDNSGDGGAGTANQGYAGGSNSDSGTGGAGGGGASAVGSAHNGNNGGNGGAGLAIEITGSSVAYAGGGGGGGQHLYSGGTGGSGGGGNGGTNNAGSNGTANTGGGAGGDGNFDNNGGTGGSGVVILRLLTSEYSSSVTGSPTVTTDGDYTILKYTGSGTYVHS